MELDDLITEVGFDDWGKIYVIKSDKKFWATGVKWAGRDFHLTCLIDVRLNGDVVCMTDIQRSTFEFRIVYYDGAFRDQLCNKWELGKVFKHDSRNINHFSDPSNDNYVFASLFGNKDNKLYRINNYTGEQIGEPIISPMGYPNVSQIEYWKINDLGLLEIKTFDDSNVYTCEVNKHAEIKKIDNYALSYDNYTVFVSQKTLIVLDCGMTPWKLSQPLRTYFGNYNSTRKYNNEFLVDGFAVARIRNRLSIKN